MAYRRWPSRQREARPLSITDVVEEPFATGKDCLSIALGGACFGLHTVASHRQLTLAAQAYAGGS
ncbi:MAG: hypothetical protein ACUVQH_13625, partial [Thermogutta sp.]